MPSYAPPHLLTLVAAVNGLCSTGMRVAKCLPGGMELGLVRAWKKTVVVLLAVAQLQSVFPSAAQAADPSALVSGVGLLDYITRQVRDLGSEAGIATILITGTATSLTYAFKASLSTAEAWRKRKELLSKYHQLEKDYLLKREELLRYPQKIQELEAENSQLREQLVESTRLGRFRDGEVLRGKIQKNDGWIAHMKSKIPAILIAEAIKSVVEAEENLHDHIQKIKHKAGQSVGLWNATKRPDYIGEYLDSPEGKKYIKTKDGSKWMSVYKEKMALLNRAAESVAASYNKVAAEHNSLANADARVAVMSVHTSHHGTTGDQFLLPPEVPSHGAEEIHRDDVPDRVSKICQQSLGYLAANVKKARKASSFSSSYRSQITSFGSLGLSAAALSVYGHYYQRRHNQTFQETQAQARRKEIIDENAKLDLKGQWESEKLSQNRMAPFTQIASNLLHAEESNIVELIRGQLTLMDDAQGGKAQLLNKRVAEILANPAAEINRVEKSVEEAVVVVANRTQMSTLDRVMSLVFTEDKVTQETILKRYLTLVYRESTANLFGGITDERVLDEVEKNIVPSLVAKTVKRLTEEVATRKNKKLEEEAAKAKAAQEGAPAVSQGEKESSDAGKTVGSAAPVEKNSVASAAPVR